MTRVCVLAALSSVVLSCASATGFASGRSALACDVGPVSKRYGGSEWRVYSCDDSKSVVVVAASGNPAAPFFSVLSPDSAGINLYGGGEGGNAATKPAFDALEILKASDLATLVSEAQKKAVLVEGAGP